MILILITWPTVAVFLTGLQSGMNLVIFQSTLVCFTHCIPLFYTFNLKLITCVLSRGRWVGGRRTFGRKRGPAGNKLKFPFFGQSDFLKYFGCLFFNFWSILLVRTLGYTSYSFSCKKVVVLVRWCQFHKCSYVLQRSW